jgi:outer membrane receptor protein involved in Fe transport
MRLTVSATAGLCLLAAAGTAQTNGEIEQIVVTATRVPEANDRVPADTSVVSGTELRARDAWDLQTGLSLVPGVEAPAGGDGGPSSAVPSFWGLHEFDAFLLVVDGVPWGGAFNPSIPTLDMNDVERIEVLKGAAPVLYGATSFVGIVQVLHYPAGQAANEADIAGGLYGSARGDISLVLPSTSDLRQSLALDGQSAGFAEKRESVSDGQLLYRAALDIGPGTLRIDADTTIERDVPPSPVLRVGTQFVTAINANFNPANATIDNNTYHGDIGWSQPTGFGAWDSLLSFAHSDIIDIRAFLHPDLSGTADTQVQHRMINDLYFDTHLTNESFENVTFIGGMDMLYGFGRQSSRNGNDAYTVPLNGSIVPPSTDVIPVNEIGTTNDKRLFLGQYLQADWKPDDRWDVMAGLRLNETFEHKFSTHLPTPPEVFESQTANKNVVRPSETIGVSYRAWQQGSGEAVLYADFRDAFKPSAIDFGPDYTPDILNPETAQSYEIGVKGAVGDGLLTYDLEAFLQNFHNLVVATPSGALANAGAEKLKGIELETRWLLAGDLALAANLAWHDARFEQYVTDDLVNVAGNDLTLSPHVLASAGLLYTPDQGWNASVVANYVGSRWLDEENTAQAGAYATLAATVGYRFGRYLVALEGTNLTNERPPVSASEFGSQSFYLLNARMIWLRFGCSL